MPRPEHYDGWEWEVGGPLLLHWLIPLIVVGGFAFLVVWAVRRLPALPVGPPYTAMAPPPRPDPALESARLRYARGEISREEYLRIAADLGAPVADAGSPPPPAA